MPVTPPITYPGVYIQEVPSGSHTIAHAPSAITVFIGRTPLGPVNEPTIVSNISEFVTLFGGLRKNNELTYAVEDFFLNGGNQAIILRLYKLPQPAPKGQKQKCLDDPSGVAIADSLNLEAASPGAWGNQLEISINRQGITASVAKQFDVTAVDLFNISINYKGQDGWGERFTNVTILPNMGSISLAHVLKHQSILVRMRTDKNDKPDLPSSLPATKTTFQFSGGQDSQPLQTSDYLGKKEKQTGLFALDKADIFNLMCIPPDKRGGDTDTAVYAAAMQYCHDRRAMLIIDPPMAWGHDKATAVDAAINGFSNLNYANAGDAARNAAFYFPRVIKTDPLDKNQPTIFAPSGIIAGIMARTDVTRGVWKPPAGSDTELSGIQSLQVNINDAGNGRLNPFGINCLRNFRAYGNVVWGARTCRGADQLSDDYKYIPVRRLALMIEESLFRGTQWAVFEPNDEPLWANLRLSAGGFMHDLFRQGAFQGQSPKDAYFVKCDSTTTTQSDINKGIVNIMVGFAAFKPGEFVVLYIQQTAGNIAA